MEWKDQNPRHRSVVLMPLHMLHHKEWIPQQYFQIASAFIACWPMRGAVKYTVALIVYLNFGSHIYYKIWYGLLSWTRTLYLLYSRWRSWAFYSRSARSGPRDTDVAVPLGIVGALFCTAASTFKKEGSWTLLKRQQRRSGSVQRGSNTPSCIV